MAQTSRDFGEFLERSLCAAAASMAVGEDGLDRIRIRIALARSSTALGDREVAVQGARSAQAGRPRTSRGHGGRLTTQKIGYVRGLDPAARQLNQALPVATGQWHRSKGRTPKPCT